MNKDELKGKVENLKERVKDATESIAKRQPANDPVRSAGSEHASGAGKEAASESAGARRAEREAKGIENEDVEDVGGDPDVDPEVEESEDE